MNNEDNFQALMRQPIGQLFFWVTGSRLYSAGRLKRYFNKERFIEDHFSVLEGHLLGPDQLEDDGTVMIPNGFELNIPF